MTALSTVLAVVIMPLVLLVYATPFTSADLQIPYGGVVSTLGVMLVPVCLGMWIRQRSRAVAARVEQAGSLSGIGVLLLLIITGIVRNGHLFAQTSAAMYTAAIALGIMGMGLGYLAARAAGLVASSRRAVAFETGIQNSPLALAIIVASFSDAQQFEVMWLPLLYALFVLLSATVITFVLRRLSA
jgi:BASS family bile acid:Na+ symporter